MAGTLTQLELDGSRLDMNQQLDATCLIWRQTDMGAVNPATGQFMAGSTVTVYEGPCWVGPILSRRDRFDVHGEQQIYQNQYRVTLPWDAFGIKIGDNFRVTNAHDLNLETRDMVVKDVLMTTDTIAQRLTVIDIKE